MALFTELTPRDQMEKYIEELRCQLKESELAGVGGGMTGILHGMHDTG